MESGGRKRGKIARRYPGRGRFFGARRTSHSAAGRHQTEETHLITSSQPLKLKCGSAIALATLMLCAATPRSVAGEGQGAPTKIAVFDFELEDDSAGAGIAGDHAADDGHLKEVSAEVRRVIEQSGRYRLVDVGAVDAAAVRDRSLLACRGCDAEIASALGAEQSLIGAVKRISRTEYVVGFQLRDAKSGALIAARDTDLQMGADYSWSRGASRLIRDRLLEAPAK
jgi:hypothetical protein